MSEFSVVVVEVGKIGKHPNADSLSITHVLGDYPVIFRTGDYKTGDKAVYVPVDAMVPDTDERWEFLSGHNRIRAKRLRGIFSMGLFTTADPSWEVGQIVQDELGILKYEAPILIGGGGDNEKCPFDFPIYTDLEGYRKYSHVLEEGEPVVLTEKIHGANGRFVYKDGRLWVGSHKCIKKEDLSTLWWKVAMDYNLEEKLATIPDVALYGEVYGYVQDLKYEMKQGQFDLAFFDALNLKTRTYLDVEDFEALVIEQLGLPTVPVLYRGPWSLDLIPEFSNGKSTIANHVREGFVVKPLKERWHDEIGRTALKAVGEDYHLRKEK